ncbi:MAG: 30S ribosomal protein S20 [Candidatus Saccharimonadales bacterium]
MPIIKSAKKRVRSAEKATVRNAKTRRSLKSATKLFHKSLTGDKKKSAELQRQAQSELGKAGKKHVIHKNKLARKQSQLAAAARTAGVKPVRQAPAKPATKKSSLKKPTAQK